VALAETVEADLPMIAELGAAAESLNRRGILLAERGGQRMFLRLAYPLYADVVVATMAPLTARRLRLRLADAIERHDVSRTGQLLQVHTLRLDAGEVLSRSDLLVGARLAADGARYLLAERFAALVLGALSPDQAAVAVEARTLLGRALVGQRRFADAEETLRAAPTSGAPSAVLAEAATVRAANLATGLHQPSAALAALDRAAVRFPAADAWRLESTWIHAAVLADRVPEVAARGRRLLDGVAAHEDLVRRVLPVTAFALEAMGDGVGAGVLLARHRPVGPVRHDRHWCAYQVALAQNAFLMGHRSELAAVLHRIERGAVDERQPGIGTWLGLLRAELHRQRGCFAEADDNFRRAHDLADELEWFASRAWILAQLAGSLAEAGRPDAGAVIGHSVGEIAAAVVAGVLSESDGARLVCRRSALLRRAVGNGAMIMVDRPFDEVRDLIGAAGDLCAAIAAAPSSTVVSGAVPAVEQAAERWAEAGWTVRRIDSDVAFHSRRWTRSAPTWPPPSPTSPPGRRGCRDTSPRATTPGPPARRTRATGRTTCATRYGSTRRFRPRCRTVTGSSWRSPRTPWSATRSPRPSRGPAAPWSPRACDVAVRNATPC